MGPFAVAILFTVIVGIQGKDLGSCNSIETDECGDKIYNTLMRPEKLPITKDDLDNYCKSLKEGRQCVADKLKSCPLKSETEDAFKQSIDFSVSDVCQSSRGKRLLDHTPCMKEKLVNFKCPDVFFAEMEGALLEKKEDQVQALCCAFSRYNRCYADEIEQKCGQPALHSVNGIAHGFVLFMTDKCLPYLVSHQACSKKSALPLPADSRKVKSILPALLELIHNTES